MNKFKKQDAKGNKLSEEIGGGLNEGHDIVKTFRRKERKSSPVSFKLEPTIHEKLTAKAEEMGVPLSFIIQELITNFLK